ncbi:MAG: efflux RND transporter permease subunit, partial [Verrucomicrobiota bacterium]
MNPAAITLKNTRTAIVIYLLLIATGISTYLNIGRREYPEFTIRNAKVIAQYPGRSALQVEQEVSEVLEQKIREMSEIEEVNSTSKPGFTVLDIEMSDAYSGLDLEDLWADMRNKVNEAQLPEGAYVASINDEFGDTFPYVYALKGDGYSAKELYDIGEFIRDELLELDGVGKISIHGDIQERIFLEYSSSELAAYGFSPDFVISKLRSQNAALSSGDVDFGTERLRITTLGEFESVE